MKTTVVFVAVYDADQIEVCNDLPRTRPLSGYPDIPVPVTQGYKLKRLRVRSETPPILPDGDLTQEEYESWRSILDPDAVTEEEVDLSRLPLDHARLCVELDLESVDYDQYRTALVANVRNIGTQPIGLVQVIWHGQWQQKGSDPLIGRGFHFNPVGSNPSVLHPGETRQFALLQPALRECLSYAAALSSDQFHLGVNASLRNQTATYEIYKMPGYSMEGVIEALERYLATEADN